MLTIIDLSNKPSETSRKQICNIDDVEAIQFIKENIENIATEYVVIVNEYERYIHGGNKFSAEITIGKYKYRNFSCVQDVSELYNLRTLSNIVFKKRTLIEIIQKSNVTSLFDVFIHALNHPGCKVENTCFSIVTAPNLLLRFQKDSNEVYDFINKHSLILDEMGFNQVSIQKLFKSLVGLYDPLKRWAKFENEVLEIDDQFANELECNFVNALSNFNGAKRYNLVTNNLHQFAELLPFIDTQKITSYSEHKKKIVIFKNDINILGGTEYFLSSIATIDKESSIIIVGLNDEGVDIGLPTNIEQIILDDNKELVQEHLLTAEFVFFTTVSIFEYVKKTVLLPKKVSFLFLGDFKDLLPNGIYKIEALYFNQYSSHFENVYVLGDNNKTLCEENFDVNNVVSIVNFYSFNENSFENEKSNFVYLSRIQKYAKNSFEIIEIGKKIKGKLVVDVFGSGRDLDEFLEEIKCNDLEDTIKYQGVLQENKIETLAKYKALLLVSTSEGFPTVVLEAMDANIATVCYDNFTLASGIVCKDNGVLVEGGRRDKFVEALYDINRGELKFPKIKEYAESLHLNSVFESLRGEEE